jgi:polyhydroxybutyrate depolymerase
MKQILMLLGLCLLLSACASSSSRWVANEKKQRPDYLAMMGAGQFDGPFAIAPRDSGREARIFLPKDYAKKDRWPLVLMLHGYTSHADETNFLLGLGAQVSKRGFLLLTPEGTVNPEGNQFWNATDFCCDFGKSGVDDVAYLLSLVDEAAKLYKVDKSRVYLYGYSNGGFMANRLLCETSGKFAGAVSLAGATFKNPDLCRVKKPVSYLQIHAEDDPTVPFGDKSKESAGGFEAVKLRAKIAGCGDTPEVKAKRDALVTIPGADTTPYVWRGCQQGTEVELWRIGEFASPDHKQHMPVFHQPRHVNATLDFLFRHKLR